MVSQDITDESDSDTELEDDDGTHQLSVTRRRSDETISWDLIAKFTLEGLENLYTRHAPVTWHVLSKFMARSRPKTRNGVYAIRRPHRPANIVCIDINFFMAPGIDC